MLSKGASFARKAPLFAKLFKMGWFVIALEVQVMQNRGIDLDCFQKKQDCVA